MLGSRIPTPRHSTENDPTDNEAFEIHSADDNDVNTLTVGAAHIDDNTIENNEASPSSLEVEIDDEAYRYRIVTDLYHRFDLNQTDEEVKNILANWANAPVRDAINDIREFHDMPLQDNFVQRRQELLRINAEVEFMKLQLAFLEAQAYFASVLMSSAMSRMMENANERDPGSTLKMMDHLLTRNARVQYHLHQLMMQTDAQIQTQHQRAQQYAYELNRLSSLCDLQSYLDIALSEREISFVGSQDDDADNVSEHEVAASADVATQTDVEADAQVDASTQTDPELPASPAPILANSPQNFWRSRPAARAVASVSQELVQPVLRRHMS